MPVFSKYSDREYEALAKKHQALEQKLEERDQSLEDALLQVKELTALNKKEAKVQKEQKEENDLLLAQLHQVQEELEKYFLENKTAQDQIAQLKKDVSAQNEKSKGLEADLKAKLSETEKKLSEANKLIKAEGDAKVNAAQKQKAELEKKLAEVSAKVADTEKKLAEASAKVADTSSQTADLQSENDLLLAQLHQVQEELEKYYLMNKSYEAGLTEAASMVKRLRLVFVKYQAKLEAGSVSVAAADALGLLEAGKPTKMTAAKTPAKGASTTKPAKPKAKTPTKVTSTTKRVMSKAKAPPKLESTTKPLGAKAKVKAKAVKKAKT